MKLATSALVASLVVAAAVPRPVAQEPASPFAATRITHVGVVVRDIAASAKRYADLFGLPVPAVTTLNGVKFRPGYRGDTSASARPKVALFHLTNIDMELIQPQGGASPWRAFLEKRGDGIHHVGFAVPDVAEAVKYMEARSAAVMLGGVAGSAVNYMDTEDQIGAVVEPEAASAFAARRVDAVSDGSFAGNRAIHVSTVVRDAVTAGEAASRLFGLPMPRPTGGVGRLSWPLTYKGDLAANVKHVTYALGDGIEFELSEAVGGASPWRDHLDTYGPSTHHVAFFVKDLARSISFLESQGGRLTLGGDGKVFYAYVELKPQPLGFTFELNGPR